MKHLNLIAVLLIALNTTKGQTVKIVELANTLLTAGTHKAAITSYDFPDNIKALQEKAVANLKANPKWADKNIVRMVERGTRNLQYMPDYGLTSEEFKTMRDSFQKGKQPVYGDTFTLTINITNGIISFKGENKLSAFDHLTINTKSNQITYDNFLFTDEREMKGDIFALTLHGFIIHSESRMAGKKKQLPEITAASIAIGKDAGSDRPTLCQVITRPGEALAEFVPLTITLL